MITAVVLNYTGKDVIERCIDRIEKQVRKPDEIIVIENGTDESSKLVEKNVTRIVRGDNKYKFIGGLNTAFQEAKLGHVLFVSNDIFLERWCLEELLCSGHDIVSPQTYDRLGRKFKNSTFSTGCFLMHTGTFDMVGEFDTNLSPAFYEDLDYSIRARRMGFTIGKDIGKAIHWASYSFSQAYDKKTISKICREHWWYVMKKHYLNRVFPSLYSGKSVCNNSLKEGYA